MNDSAFRIKYGAVNGSDGLEDFKEIDEFKSAMSSSYTVLLKPVLQERGGEAYHLMIEWFSHHSFKDYFEIVGGFLAGKMLDKISDPIINKYLFNPFKMAYKKLKEKNDWRLGICTFSMDFSDTSLSIYSFSPESIFDNFDFILANLYRLYQIIKQDRRLPLGIQIPVIKEESNKIIYRLPEEKDEILFHQTDRNLYAEYWRLFYHLPERYLIFDVQKGDITRSPIL